MREGERAAVRLDTEPQNIRAECLGFFHVARLTCVVKVASRVRGYFLAPAPAPGFSFKNGDDGAAGFGFSALGFFGSRLLLF